MVFYSPELAMYIQENERVTGKDLTTKSDIFALGLLFSLYLTGNLPAFDQEKYQYACVAVNRGETLILNASELPEELNAMINQMLLDDYKKRPDVAKVFEQLKNLNIKSTPEKIPLKDIKLKGGLTSKSDGTTDSTEVPSQGGLRGKGLNIGKK